MSETPGPDRNVLPDGIRSRMVAGVNGLAMHVLEAGFDMPGRPALLLLHGFPELAFSWRCVMAPLAAAGYHVIAPDQRGYGRTTGWDADYDGDLVPFGLINLVRDSVALVRALGHAEVAAVVGHDFGASVAAYCALIRPDMFRRVALMSAPFEGPPAFALGSGLDDHGHGRAPTAEKPQDIHQDLAALDRPRKHYQRYYSTREANDQMWHCGQGVGNFLRGYFHGKSADWPGNDPQPLDAWTAQDLARMPTYYIMDLDQDMAETAATFMPSPADIAACAWLPDQVLQVYAAEFGRTGFQGGLQWYRCRFDAGLQDDLRLYSGRTIDVPSCFIAGDKDWGAYQRPGALATMQTRACSNMQSITLVPSAGHWVQQEQPEAVVELLQNFLAD